jgi:hypothetical protein
MDSCSSWTLHYVDVLTMHFLRQVRGSMSHGTIPLAVRPTALLTIGQEHAVVVALGCPRRTPHVLTSW